MALGLLALGLKRDEVLLAQLYNSVEVNLIRLACEKAGILLAIVPYTFRHAELEAVLQQVEAKGVFIPYEFRNFNYFEMFEKIRPRLPALQYIFVIGDRVPSTAISIREMMERPLETKCSDNYLESLTFIPLSSKRL